MYKQVTMTQEEIVEAVKFNILNSKTIHAIINEENHAEPFSRRTLLFLAAYHCKDISIFKSILASYGDKSSGAAAKTTNEGWNTIHVAARYGDPIMLNAVITIPNFDAAVAAAETTLNDWNAMDLAVRNGDPAMVNTLVAIPNFDAAVAAAKTDVFGRNALYVAVRYGDVAMLNAVIAIPNFDAAVAAVEMTKDGWNALFMATFRTDDDSVVIQLIRLVGLEQALAQYRDFTADDAEKQTAHSRLGIVLEILSYMANNQGLVPTRFKVLPEPECGKIEFVITDEIIKSACERFNMPVPYRPPREQLRRIETLMLIWRLTISHLMDLPMELLLTIALETLNTESKEQYRHGFEEGSIVRQPGRLFFQSQFMPATEMKVVQPKSKKQSWCMLQ